MRAEQIPFSDVILVRDDLQRRLRYLDTWAQQYPIRCAFMRGNVFDKEREAFLQKSQAYMRGIENDVHYLRQAYERALQLLK